MSNLYQYDAYRDQVKTRLMSEVNDLQKRVIQLKQSPSINSQVIISTYERMIDQKQSFMRNWDMSERASLG